MRHRKAHSGGIPAPVPSSRETTALCRNADSARAAMRRGPRAPPRTACSFRDRACAPDIDAGEEEQPHHVDEVPIPSGRFEAEVPGRDEMTLDRTEQADGEEGRADDH